MPAWVSPATFSSGATLTAAQLNTNVRDNSLFLKDRFGSNITNPGFNVFEPTNSTAFTDLTSAGPAVTLTTGTSVLVYIDCVAYITSATYAAMMSFAVSGATTLAAAVAQCVWTQNTTATGISRWVPITGLTAGSNTFTAKYATLNATFTANFSQRDMIVVLL